MDLPGEASSENSKWPKRANHMQGVRTPHPPPRDDLRFSNTTGILPKKKLCGFLVLK